jgi:hypothetical protein
LLFVTVYRRVGAVLPELNDFCSCSSSSALHLCRYTGFTICNIYVYTLADQCHTDGLIGDSLDDVAAAAAPTVVNVVGFGFFIGCGMANSAGGGAATRLGLTFAVDVCFVGEFESNEKLTTFVDRLPARTRAQMSQMLNEFTSRRLRLAASAHFFVAVLIDRNRWRRSICNETNTLRMDRRTNPTATRMFDDLVKAKRIRRWTATE